MVSNHAALCPPQRTARHGRRRQLRESTGTSDRTKPGTGRRRRPFLPRDNAQLTRRVRVRCRSHPAVSSDAVQRVRTRSARPTASRRTRPIARAAGRPCCSAASGSVTLRVVDVHAAFDDRPARCRPGVDEPGRDQQVDHARQRIGGDRDDSGLRSAAARVASSRSASSPRPNNAALAAIARAHSSAPCTSVVNSSASARWASRAAGRCCDRGLQLFDLLAWARLKIFR